MRKERAITLTRDNYLNKNKSKRYDVNDNIKQRTYVWTDKSGKPKTITKMSTPDLLKAIKEIKNSSLKNILINEKDSNYWLEIMAFNMQELIKNRKRYRS